MLSTRRSGRDSLVQQVLLPEARVIPLSVVVSVRPLDTRYASPAFEGSHPDWLPSFSLTLIPGDPSMRTVGGSTGCLAVCLLIWAKRVGEAGAHLPQDRRSAERQYPDSRQSGLSV